MKRKTMLLWLMAWKLPSSFTQVFMASIIASQGSSEEPFVNLRKIAYMGAWVAALRTTDALLDMTFGRLVHGHTQDDVPPKAGI